MISVLHCMSPIASHRGLRDGMKRWTNGLPGATKRLGAMMALRGLSPSQPGCARIPMVVRSEIWSTTRPNTLWQISRSSILEAHLAPRGLDIGDDLERQDDAWNRGK